MREAPQLKFWHLHQQRQLLQLRECCDRHQVPAVHARVRVLELQAAQARQAGPQRLQLSWGGWVAQLELQVPRHARAAAGCEPWLELLCQGRPGGGRQVWPRSAAVEQQGGGFPAC